MGSRSKVPTTPKLVRLSKEALHIIRTMRFITDRNDSDIIREAISLLEEKHKEQFDAINHLRSKNHK